MMTKKEFEKFYAEKAGVTIEKLRKHGFRAIPCNCDYEDCNGWRMEYNIDVMLKNWGEIKNDR